MLNAILELTPTSRGLLLEMASEHPKIKDVINARLPGISSFMEAHQTICKKFQSHKDKKDGRWLNSSIFFNPAFTWDKYTKYNKKGEKNPYNLVNPSDFSFPKNTRITIKQLFFPGNHYISRVEFNSLVGKQVEWLNYAPLKNC